MRPWDLNYYMRVFKSQCSDIRMNKLLWPARGYICQVARFDPAKGIPDVVDSFCKLRRRLDDILPASKTPQLLICGHGAIDDREWYARAIPTETNFRPIFQPMLPSSTVRGVE